MTRSPTGIDWNKDGTIDEWAPPVGFVPSGTAGTTPHQWPTNGSYTFQALAKDDQGNQSGWSTYTVTVSQSAPTVVLQTSTTVFTQGDPPATLTWASSNATNCTATNFNNSGQLNGSTTVTPTQTTTYTITCTGAGGSATDAKTITYQSASCSQPPICQTRIPSSTNAPALSLPVLPPNIASMAPASRTPASQPSPASMRIRSSTAARVRPLPVMQTRSARTAPASVIRAPLSTPPAATTSLISAPAASPERVPPLLSARAAPASFLCHPARSRCCRHSPSWRAHDADVEHSPCSDQLLRGLQHQRRHLDSSACRQCARLPILAHNWHDRLHADVHRRRWVDFPARAFCESYTQFSGEVGAYLVRPSRLSPDSLSVIPKPARRPSNTSFRSATISENSYAAIFSVHFADCQDRSVSRVVCSRVFADHHLVCIHTLGHSRGLLVPDAISLYSRAASFDRAGRCRCAC